MDHAWRHYYALAPFMPLEVTVSNLAAMHSCSNPKYAGFSIWNRSTRRLGGPNVKVPESDWIVKPGAFEAVIDPRLYAEAQRILNERRCRKSNDDILEELRALLDSKGKLSRTILRTTPGVPSITICKRRFGDLQRAFALAGYAPQ
jgi:recombinase